MKFMVAKLPNFFKNSEKSLNAKKTTKNQTQSRKEQEIQINLCCDGRKGFITSQNQCRHYGGPCTPIFVTKNAFFETSNNDKKTDNDAERNNNAQSRLID